ncbi:MAG: hypothetical protein SCJ94_06815 [Bacillota bacterium]|nr:hypothetical protein [Bacillota bacterium]
MARTCTICNHRKRQEIEGDLQRGVSLRTLADQSGTSKSALLRHKNNCLPLNLTIQGSVEGIKNGPDPLQRVENLIGRLELMTRKLEKPKSAPLFYQGCRELTRCLELAERMKAHYLNEYKTERNRRERAEAEGIQLLTQDTALLREVQEAVDRAEARLIASGRLQAEPH